MEEIITNYLVTEKQVDSEIARKVVLAKILKYDDIVTEFMQWLETRTYRDDGLEIMGYRAQDVYAMAPFLDGIGVYEFLVTLRDNPKRGQEIIESGFAIK